MTTIKAEAIALSENIDTRQRIATLRLTYPRFIHAEFMTHRAISKNASSSRAIPIARMIERVERDPVIPLHWGRNQPGMQAEEESNAPVDVRWMDGMSSNDTQSLTREQAWRMALDTAVLTARSFANADYHKQVVNRLLEPFAHMTVVATATLPEWEAMLHLRMHAAAEPHFQLLAGEIARTLEGGEYYPMCIGQWHLPFTDVENRRKWFENAVLSVARCAHTSYDTVDGYKMDFSRAHKIVREMVDADRFHASPFEHQARASDHVTRSRNFSGGWMQLRHLVEDNVLKL